MATINDMGVPAVGTGILQPKLKHKWRVTFANLGGGVDSQPLSFQATAISRPNLSFQEVELHRYNSKSWIGSKHTWETCSITVEDDVTGTATQIIQEQMQKQQWLIGAEGPWLGSAGEGSLYKFVTYLDMLDGREQVIEQWTLEGCWIQACNWNELDYSNGEQVTISLTMRFDHARQQVGGYNQGEGVATGGAGRINA